MHDVTLDLSTRLLRAGIAKANELGVTVNIAIVDRGANLHSFVRMDGAWLGSIDIAIKKARTSRLFDRESKALGVLSQPGGPIFGIEHSNGGLVTFAGGVPIRNEQEEIIGAIAVSGSTVDNDELVALAAIAAI